MTRRVLIVSPHFPPINAPDHQRVRMSLPYLGEAGWEAVILTVNPDKIEGVRDPLLEKTIPEDVRVVRTSAMSVNSTRKVGLGDLGMRSLPYLRRDGNRLLSAEKFDLVYFSTTVFMTMTLGPGWRRRFNVPYVLDFQDPWVNDYYDRPGAPRPPGGRIKYGVSQATARIFEPYIVRRMNHAICVSPSYPQSLRRRYRWLREDQFTVLPFGAPERDFEYLASLDIKQGIFDPADGFRHWVYVGAVGPIMKFALKALFHAVRAERDHDPEKWRAVKMHFVGTSYATGARAKKSVEPLAEECGVADLVTEDPARLPYFEALKVMVDSDAVLLIGSDNPGYTASKVYPYILARKPLLGIFHEESSVVNIIRGCKAGDIVTFNSHDVPLGVSTKVAEQLRRLLSLSKGAGPETDWSWFYTYTAAEMTRRQCDVFNLCLARNN